MLTIGGDVTDDFQQSTLLETIVSYGYEFVPLSMSEVHFMTVQTNGGQGTVPLKITISN